MTNKKNLWILTEERPKTNVLEVILSYFAKDRKCGYLGGTLKIIPLLNKGGNFTFTYQVVGFVCNRVEKMYVKIVSGTSSFTDFLIYYQEKLPTYEDTPLYAIEETKTDDKESRNTGVYQRCTKFVYIRHFYPKTKLLMLYALQVEQKERPTETYIFGTRLLMTYGVEILGKRLDKRVFKSFSNLDEMIDFKNKMRRPKVPTNVPILIKKRSDQIEISGRLIKNNQLAHDPNIGALTIISAVLRTLGWQKKIVITSHGLIQSQVGTNNKFVQIANRLKISLQGINMPKSELPDNYWHYDDKGEKLATIFIHIVVENFTEGYSIFENHAGCEKGYFQTSKGERIPLAKYTDKEEYKKGDKTKIVSIPDLVLLDKKETEIISIEGKKYEYLKKGIEQLKGYKAFEDLYLRKYYPQFKLSRSVVVYGSDKENIKEIEVSFLLNKKGKIVLGIKVPQLIIRAIRNLLDFWK